METMVRARALNGYFQVVKRLGFNPQSALRETGLDVALLADPDQPVPISMVCQLLEKTSNGLQGASIGLQMAESRQEMDFGVLGLLLTHQRTLRDVLQAIIHYRHMINPALGLRLDTMDDTVVIYDEIIADPHFPLRQVNELAMGVLTRTCHAFLGAHWRPSAVNFTHAAPADASLHRRFFGCAVKFGSDFNGVVCLAKDLNFINPNADPELVRYAENLIKPRNVPDSGGFTCQVKRTIYQLLPLERATVEQVAAGLHLSVRTLQRQLAAAGYSFSDLMEEVRRILASRYMMNPNYRISHVATMLGFMRQASFTRWFAAHFGMAPREWRSRQKQKR
jgi:AraC-like DNA-binding protein